MFLIKKKETGEYVSLSGSKSSYTRNRAYAREYPTIESARRDACGNEVIVETLALVHITERAVTKMEDLC